MPSKVFGGIMVSCALTIAGLTILAHQATARQLPATQATETASMQVFVPYAAKMQPPTSTPTPTVTPTPTATTIPFDSGEEVLVPADEFQMGCDPSVGNGCFNEDQLLHTVFLNEYHIDKYEVTNARYSACVSAGICSPPGFSGSNTHDSYYGNPLYDNYPVIYVNWFQASAFCAWEGKRLPSEAEWEKAARGASDTRIWPWGNESPTCAQANIDNRNIGRFCVGDTVAVGSYPSGASQYGAMDMSGNVYEWVNDWYASDYYQASPYANPPGPAAGTIRVIRGGSWMHSNGESSVQYRRNYDPPSPDYQWDPQGFRCAR